MKRSPAKKPTKKRARSSGKKAPPSASAPVPAAKCTTAETSLETPRVLALVPPESTAAGPAAPPPHDRPRRKGKEPRSDQADAKPIVRQLPQDWRANARDSNGGLLKTGGNNGGGRPREAVRLAALERTEESVEWYRMVRDGEILEEHVTMFGRIVLAPPAIRDRLRAAEALERISCVTKDSKARKGERVLRVKFEDLPEILARRQA